MPINKLIKELTPIQDTREHLRRHLLWLLMARVILFTLLIAITVVLQSKGRNVILPPSTITMAFLAVVFIYSIGSAGLLQNKTSHLPRFGLIQLLSDTVFAALLVLGTGCSQSIFTPIFIFPVITGGLNLNRTGGLVAAASASILYGTMLTCEYLGYIPPFYAHTNYIPPDHYLDITNIYAVYGLTFFTIGLFSSILAGRLRTTEEALSRTSVQFDRLNQLYKQIFEDINTGIITVDGRNLVTSCNIAFEKITGVSTKQIIGLPFNAFFPTVILTETDQSKQVADLKRQDESETRVRYTFAQLNLPSDPGFEDDYADARCKVITMQDISLLEKMERQVRDSEKMATVGELSAAVAHDFRNPLAAISGSAQILNIHIKDSQQKTEDPINSTNRHLSEIILRESDRMEKTINDFLQFSQPKPLTQEWFDLKRMAIDAVKRIQGKKSRYPGCVIIDDIPDHFDCWADREQLQIVLVHLMENSCRASAQNSQPLVIKAEEEKGKKESCIRISVIDQGTGIAKEIQKDIFTPFFSTREDSAGLGLAIVKQLIEQHEGTVSLPKFEGEGCVVELRLPLPASSED